MAKKIKTYHPMIELTTACEMAGHALLKIAGGLQERHNTEQSATGTQIEGIDQAGNDVLKAIAAYTASQA